jgi:enamine deaminase RidA (YjgF/YER057c/UK114 family)
MGKNKTLHISSGAPYEETVGYSRAVRKGNQIWVSGTTSMKEGMIVGIGDPYRQALQCLRIIKTAIEAAEGTLDDVVRTRIYITKITDWEHVARAHSEFFGKIKPATTMVIVKGLISPEMLVEIEAEAVVE